VWCPEAADGGSWSPHLLGGRGHLLRTAFGEPLLPRLGGCYRHTCDRAGRYGLARIELRGADRLARHHTDCAVAPPSRGMPAVGAVPMGLLSHFAAPVRAPLLSRTSVGRRATRMTCNAPVRTGGAVLAGSDLD